MLQTIKIYCVINMHYQVSSVPKLEYLSFKEVLNPNFLNLTINSEKFGSRNVLVSFLNLILLKSCKRTSP